MKTEEKASKEAPYQGDQGKNNILDKLCLEAQKTDLLKQIADLETAILKANREALKLIKYWEGHYNTYNNFPKPNQEVIKLTGKLKMILGRLRLTHNWRRLKILERMFWIQLSVRIQGKYKSG
ncbi:MAG: hypothetical protein HC912_13150 [Saprospiraceae bacterium]|nr:hypothetical protein [Saprospiraceae bacterium]